MSKKVPSATDAARSNLEEELDRRLRTGPPGTDASEALPARSPLAQALPGRKPGDTVAYSTPRARTRSS